MTHKYHFIISKYCPLEVIYDGFMTFTEARKLMDKNATFERRVGFRVFNDKLRKWEDYRHAYHGNRRVFQDGDLYLLDKEYENLIPQKDKNNYI